MVCSPQPVRYYVRRALQCVTVFETPMDRDTYTEFRTLPVENFFCDLKQFRRIATRYDKTDTSYAAMIYIAAVRFALK